MRSRLTAVAVAAALALATPAMLLAQPVGPPPDRPSDQMPGWGWGPGAMMGWLYGMMEDLDQYRGPMMGRGGFGPGMMGGMMGGPTQFVEGRIAFLEAELKITDAQKPLFDAFATAVRDSAESMEPMHQRMWSGDVPESLPDRLQWQIDEMTSRLQAMETVKAAALPLYDALSAGQKTVADRIFWPMGMM